MDDNTYDFDLAKAPQTIIKVIGVGGGGGNAVSNMYREGIRDVSFVLCNTDNQALQKSEVPNKLLIGQNTRMDLVRGMFRKWEKKPPWKVKKTSTGCWMTVLVWPLLRPEWGVVREQEPGR